MDLQFDLNFDFDDKELEALPSETNDGISIERNAAGGKKLKFKLGKQDPLEAELEALLNAPVPEEDDGKPAPKKANRRKNIKAIKSTFSKESQAAQMLEKQRLEEFVCLLARWAPPSLTRPHRKGHQKHKMLILSQTYATWQRQARP